MAKYKSPHYPALGFYVNGSFRRFSGGQFITEEVEEIKVLDALSDVVRIDEPEEPKATVEAEPDKPKPTRRTSTKASAK